MYLHMQETGKKSEAEKDQLFAVIHSHAEDPGWVLCDSGFFLENFPASLQIPYSADTPN